MRSTFLASAFVVLTGASLGLAQAPAPAPSPQAAPPSALLDDHSAGQGAGGPPGRFWVNAEYLLWWIKGTPLPPLVTTGSAASGNAGALGDPGTVVLFGGNTPDPGAFSGGRFTAGFWLNDCHKLGIEGSYFFLGSRSKDFSASSDGSTVLARPIFDTSTGAEGAEVDAFPTLASGSKLVQSSSRLQGPELNLLCNLCCSCNDCCNPCAPCHGYRVDFISGLRYLDLKEKLRIAETSQFFADAFPPDSVGAPLNGTAISAFDEFDTHNQFFGAQIGARAEVWRNRLFANITGKVALGVTHQTVDISGASAFTPPGGSATVFAGDLLAQPSNIGHYSRDQFSVVPEVDINVGYQITNNLRVYVGYTFLFWSGVERPGAAIDTQVNGSGVPLDRFLGFAPTGPLAPLFSFQNSSFWAQGISAGFQLRF